MEKKRAKSFLSLDSFTKINRPGEGRAQKFRINYEIMISFISCFIYFVERKHIPVMDFPLKLSNLKSLRIQMLFFNRGTKKIKKRRSEEELFEKLWKYSCRKREIFRVKNEEKAELIEKSKSTK